MTDYTFTKVKRRHVPVTERECAECHEVKRIPSNRKICFACRRFKVLVNNETVRPPDYPDVNVANYKEPMEKVAEGFGYYGALTETNDGEHVQCHLCGYFFKALGSHVVHKHQLKPRDYKIKFGLRIKDGMLSPVARKEAQVHYNKFARKTPEEYRAMFEKARAARKVKPGRSIHKGLYAPQTRNEKGICREQTLAKIHALARSNDGRVTWPMFRREYGDQSSVIYTWFGGWNKALEIAGLDTYYERLDIDRKKKRPHAEESVRHFYEENGRTPQCSDFQSVDYLPTRGYIRKEYGTINNLRSVAGVPLLVRKGRGGGFVEYLPSNIEPIRRKIEVRYA